jgi:hypothetical protein
VLGAEVGIQVSWFDARELCQVVHHLLLCWDVVINEWCSFQWTIPVIEVTCRQNITWIRAILLSWAVGGTECGKRSNI